MMSTVSDGEVWITDPLVNNDEMTTHTGAGLSVHDGYGVQLHWWYGWDTGTHRLSASDAAALRDALTELLKAGSFPPASQ